MRFANLAVESVAVLEHVDLGRCRRDALGRDRAPDQRVDKGTLAGIELANDDEQKQFVELFNGAIERVLMLGRGVEAHERRAQPGKDPPLLFDQLILAAGQNLPKHPRQWVHFLFRRLAVRGWRLRSRRGNLERRVAQTS
jgi:hypothetical protein